jgi:hypothetical protein
LLRLLAAAVVAVATAAGVPEARAQAQARAAPLLDVPYLPQSEQLCGGAAVAMVMRYWGASGVYAETFAPLVDVAAGGIRGADLLQALRTMGWTAESFRGDRDVVQQHLSARRPIVVLLEDRPARFHYVVVVGWSNARVVIHDPARSPFRVLDDRDFLEAWRASGFWSLVATPPAGGLPESAKGSTVVASPDRHPASDGEKRSLCDGMIEEGVRLAGSAEAATARRVFDLAAETCPGSSAPHREIAGLYALHGEWKEAARSARRAITLDKDDAHAWRILATSLYLEGDDLGALAAWNRIGEPSIDLVSVHGLRNTRYAVVSAIMDLSPRTLLSAEAMTAARRRLAELPSAQTTRVVYRPAESGRAEVDAAVIERAVLPTSMISLVAEGVRAATDREVRAGFASPTGGGELWTIGWRWWERRPRFGVAFSAPSPFGGVWGVSAFSEKQSYAAASNGPVVEARRRSVDFHVSAWTVSGFRWEAGAGVDEWRGLGRAVHTTVVGERRFAREAGVVEARANAWAGGVRTWSGSLRAGWRSAGSPQEDHWIGRGGVDVAGAGAPLDLWPGAGTGQGRDLLLRAHPLLADGVITDAVFGRRLVHGGVEWRRPLPPVRRFVRLAPAVFVDSARASGGPVRFDQRTHVDVGAGLRLTIPAAGVIRIDLARGLRDGALALSAGIAVR